MPHSSRFRLFNGAVAWHTLPSFHSMQSHRHRHRGLAPPQMSVWPRCFIGLTAPRSRLVHCWSCLTDAVYSPFIALVWIICSSSPHQAVRTYSYSHINMELTAAPHAPPSSPILCCNSAVASHWTLMRLHRVCGGQGSRLNAPWVSCICP